MMPPPASLPATGLGTYVVLDGSRSKQLMANLLAPNKRNSNFWKKEERLLFQMARYIGGRAERYAKRIIDGVAMSGSVGAELAAVTAGTASLRTRNRNSNKPLKEFGRMRGSIQARIIRTQSVGSGGTIQILLGGNPRTMARGEGSTSSGGLTMDRLARMHEFGYKITVTVNMKKYFMAMSAGASGGAKHKAYNALGNLSSNVDSERKDIWRGLSLLPLGTIMAVPARPFLQPSLKAARQDFIDSRTQEFADAFGDLWFRGAVNTQAFQPGGD